MQFSRSLFKILRTTIFSIVLQVGGTAAYGQNFDVYGDGNYSLKSINNMGSTVGYLEAYKYHAGRNPNLRIAMEAHNAQIAVAARESGGFDRISEERWTEIRKNTQNLRADLETRRKNALGKWEYSDAIRALFLGTGGVVGGAGGTFVAGPGTGTAMGALIGTAAATALFDKYQGYLTDKVQISAGDLYAQSLNGKPNLKEQAEAHVYCTKSVLCKQIWASEFGMDFNNTALDADYATWISNDPVLRQTAMFNESMAKSNEMMDKLDKILEKVSRAGSQEEADKIIAEELTKFSEDLKADIKESFGVAVGDLLNQLKPKLPYFSERKINDVKAGFQAGEILATLTGNDKSAYAFREFGNITTGIMYDYNDMRDNKMSSAAMSIATLNYVMMAATVMQNLRAKKGPSFEEAVMAQFQEILRQIEDLKQLMIQGFSDTNSNIIITTNITNSKIHEVKAISNRIRELVNNLVLRSLKSDFSDFIQSENAIVNKFNQYCKDNHRPLKVNKCYEDLVNFATGTESIFRNLDYAFITDPRQIFNSKVRTNIVDEALPFSEHLPAMWQLIDDATTFDNNLLATKNTTNDILDRQIPKYWIIGATAYLNLLNLQLKENPASIKIDLVRSHLQRLIKKGVEVSKSISEMNYTSEEVPQVSFANHNRLLSEYKMRLMKLASAAGQTDIGDPYGRNHLSSLKQNMPISKFEAFYEILAKSHGRHIKTCEESAATNFLIDPKKAMNGYRGKLLYKKQFDFELRTSWNKEFIDKAKLSLPMPAVMQQIIPAEIIWAQTAGLGEVKICISKFKPLQAVESANFPQAGVYLTSFDIIAEIDIQFVAYPNTLIKLKEKQVEIPKPLNDKKSEENTAQAILLRRYSIAPKTLYVKAIGGYYATNRTVSSFIYKYWDGVGGDKTIKPERGLPEVLVENMPLQSNIHKGNQTYSSPLLEPIIEKISEIYFENQIDNTLATLNHITSSDNKTDASSEFISAQDFYDTYYVYVAQGFSQILNSKYSTGQLFGLRLISPTALLHLMVVSHPTNNAIEEAVDKSIGRSMDYFKETNTWLLDLPSGDEQRKPLPTQTIEQTIERLKLMEGLL